MVAHMLLDQRKIEVKWRGWHPWCSLVLQRPNVQLRVPEEAGSLVNQTGRRDLILHCRSQQVLIVLNAVIAGSEKVAYDVSACGEWSAARTEVVMVRTETMLHELHEAVAPLTPGRSRQHVVLLLQLHALPQLHSNLTIPMRKFIRTLTLLLTLTLTLTLTLALTLTLLLLRASRRSSGRLRPARRAALQVSAADGRSGRAERTARLHAAQRD